MKTNRLLIHAASVIAMPLFAMAADPSEPGKTSDALTNPPAQPPTRSESPASTSTTENERRFSGRITSVNRTGNTITVDDQTRGTQVFTISDATQLKRGDSIGSWDDLKVGENVWGLFREEGAQAQASSITIGK